MARARITIIATVEYDLPDSGCRPVKALAVDCQRAEADPEGFIRTLHAVRPDTAWSWSVTGVLVGG